MMKSYKHLFQGEINKLKASVSKDPTNKDNLLMLNFMQEAAVMDVDKLSKDLQKCIEAWPCVKTVLIMTIWLLLRENDRRAKQTV